MTVADKLAKPGPRKLLALDGGGIRGLITVEVLAEIERLLREESGGGRRVRARRLLRLHRRHQHRRDHRHLPLARDARRRDPRLLPRERRRTMFDKASLLRALPLQVRGRPARATAQAGARRGHDARERAAADAAADRHAQRDDRLAVAALEQPGAKYNLPAPGVPATSTSRSGSSCARAPRRRPTSRPR